MQIEDYLLAIKGNFQEMELEAIYPNLKSNYLHNIIVSNFVDEMIRSIVSQHFPFRKRNFYSQYLSFSKEIHCILGQEREYQKCHWYLLIFFSILFRFNSKGVFAWKKLYLPFLVITRIHLITALFLGNSTVSPAKVKIS